MDSSNSMTMLNPKTKNYPDGSMTNLRTELSVIAGFIGAFILAFLVWCILFKYFSDKEDRKRAVVMARGVEMRGSVRHQREGDGVAGTTGALVLDGDAKGLLVEESTSSS
jgi:hypothetical protein